MFSSITNWFTGNSNAVDSEWRVWLEWQKHQSPSHYTSSYVFKYFLKYNASFEPFSHNAMKDDNWKYYHYCFGDFTPLITIFGTEKDLLKYVNILLAVYDTCKGIARRVSGDPPGIVIMRQAITLNNSAILFEHDYTQYSYNYGYLHAHTVAVYSLSTLLLRLLSNYLYSISITRKFANISLQLCHMAHKNSNYGELIYENPAAPAPTAPVNIPSAASSSTSSYPLNIACKEITSTSCPSYGTDHLKCHKCYRITEKLWGYFNVCLDCHLKRVCSKCGCISCDIAADGFPRCYYHIGQPDQSTIRHPLTDM